ncbi:MAG: HAMP domain-containing sensor histidine kinase [Rubrimonas sp.]|uniref:sensor histidine kinase n=1 Tax=Rubrimonas sp. TaxID=2036015 RepID=UPI002FDEC018
MKRSLSGRLLLVTLATGLAMSTLILAPAMAVYRQDVLTERLRLAQLASLAILATPEGMLDDRLERELLRRAGAASVVLRRDGARALVLSAVTPREVDATYDLRAPGWAALLTDAARLAVDPTPRHVRVIGRPYRDGVDEVEITMDEAPMRAAMLEQGGRLLIAALAISLTTAALLYLLVQRLLVTPMRRLTRNMARFRDAPEDPSRIVRPSSRVAEIAVAEQALAQMQTDVLQSLRERARLAALGAAVAKISHDLRNILSSALLSADRMEASRDPALSRAAAKLVSALDRAVKLCESTLRYGRAEEAPPEPRAVSLRALIDEVIEQVSPDGAPPMVNATPPDLFAAADPDHLHRILANLARNAREALLGAERGGAVRFVARAAPERDGLVEIDVEDDGPGLPVQAVENLFQPFRGGARKGGFGLGLPIAQELAQMQGGTLALIRSTSEGTCFRLTLPAPEAEPLRRSAAPRARPVLVAHAGFAAPRKKMAEREPGQVQQGGEGTKPQ